jgi:glyoxylase-like metal-dependent hydrolase (beta-lactamase superfamily II)
MEPRILSNLWQVGGPGFSSPEDAAIYLVRFGDKGALIDAGCGNGHEALTSNISRCIPETVAIEYLLVTHCHYDHTGGAEAVRNAYGCRIVAHALDAVYLESGDSQVTAASWYGADMRPLSVDIKITGDAQSISIGEGHVAAYHWPGHSPGSLVYTTKMEDKTVLFGQDVHGPLDPSLLSDPEAYQTSLKKLLELDADILCEGHFGVYHGKRAVQRFIRSFMI